MSYGEREERVFDKPSAEKILQEIISYFPKDQIVVEISSWWGAGQRWARNTASLTSDRRQVAVSITEPRTRTTAGTNQCDSPSLKSIAEAVQYYSSERMGNRPTDRIVDPVRWISEGTNVWSDATYNVAADDISKSIANLTQRVAREDLLSAGYIEATGSSALLFRRDPWNRESSSWGSVTQARCSATVRHPLGNGSGWAGKTSFEWNRLAIDALVGLAFEKCKLSLNPVRIEPGRYQTILEPDAVGTLTSLLIGALHRGGPEGGRPVATYLMADPSYNRFRSKIGLKLVDERINISHDPSDPLMGTHPAPAVRKVKVIENGILTNLWQEPEDRINDSNDLDVPVFRRSYAIAGGSVGLDEMIRTTERGLLVARLSLPEGIDEQSLLYTGVTRDGVWLIERGKITKAVRNMRWTESPLFALNNLEQLGPQEPLFRPIESQVPLLRGFQNSLRNMLVPSMKINDFSFTSTIDAV